VLLSLLNLCVGYLQHTDINGLFLYRGAPGAALGGWAGSGPVQQAEETCQVQGFDFFAGFHGDKWLFSGVKSTANQGQWNTLKSPQPGLENFAIQGLCHYNSAPLNPGITNLQVFIDAHSKAERKRAF
jgi:hypothetical protein